MLRRFFLAVCAIPQSGGSPQQARHRSAGATCAFHRPIRRTRHDDALADANALLSHRLPDQIIAVKLVGDQLFLYRTDGSAYPETVQLAKQI
jgi:hypothetical protein